jgi:succinoglycan biosynthesis transport protein ExoP
VQRALAPQTPSFPKKLPMIAFASLAGFVLSLGAVIVGELLKAPPRGAIASPHEHARISNPYDRVTEV